MCHWMGSHFHDLIDYHGVAFLKELLELGPSHIFWFLEWDSSSYSRLANVNSRLTENEISLSRIKRIPTLYDPSLRSKRFRGVGEQRKTEQRCFRCFARSENGARAKIRKKGVGEGN